MICYVTHIYEGKQLNLERAKKVMKRLQKRDLANCYICPLFAFSHLEYGEIGRENETEIRLDLLTCADRLIVASKITKEMQTEIDFAKLVKMEVLRLEENGELQPFTE